MKSLGATTIVIPALYQSFYILQMSSYTCSRMMNLSLLNFGIRMRALILIQETEFRRITGGFYCEAQRLKQI